MDRDGVQKDSGDQIFTKHKKNKKIKDFLILDFVRVTSLQLYLLCSTLLLHAYLKRALNVSGLKQGITLTERETVNTHY